MTGTPKPTPIEAFDLNLADARWLIQTARVLQNQRFRRMRKELRGKVGDLMNLPVKITTSLIALRVRTSLLSSSRERPSIGVT